MPGLNEGKADFIAEVRGEVLDEVLAEIDRLVRETAQKTDNGQIDKGDGIGRVLTLAVLRKRVDAL